MDKHRLLLHICCAPDATYVAKLLEDGYEITGYFYNPNIQPKEEYEKRLSEAERLFKLWNMKFDRGDYDADGWFKEIKGFENEPEGGKRCEVCFQFRLKRVAQFAKEKGYNIFTTTLTISPHKNSAVINRSGENLAGQFEIDFLSCDFKRQNGFKKSVRMAKNLRLYRQNYCGCIFSRWEREFSKLVKEIKNCQRCKLPGESHPVISGQWGNRIMLVGQAPGKVELKTGLPFSGPAGRRLFGWLSQAGIEEPVFRSSTFMTQVMKCYPGPGVKGDRKPSLEELGNCAPFLNREIELMKPRVLILVGQLAIERLLGGRRLGEVVGRLFKREIAGNECRLIPLPHPSGLNVWSFKKENVRLLKEAIGLIKAEVSHSF